MLVIDAFAGLFIAVALAAADRVGKSKADSAIAEYEDANEHASTHRDAQG